MADYKQMYYKLFRASEEAIRILITAQQECEELYINQPDPELSILTLAARYENSTDEQ